MMAGIACTLVGGVLWGVNGSVSKILMEQYTHASPVMGGVRARRSSPG